jgi:hypothetical protein
MPGADATNRHGPSADRCTPAGADGDTEPEEVGLGATVVVDPAVEGADVDVVPSVGATVWALGKVGGCALPLLHAAMSAAPARHDQGTMCRRIDVLRRWTRGAVVSS